MPKRGFAELSLGPSPVLPESTFFQVTNWAHGLVEADAPEDAQIGESPDMVDMEVTIDDRLVRAPGVVAAETLANAPSQVLLHAGFGAASDMVFLAPPFIGIRNTGATQWYNVGMLPGPWGYTNYAGVLLLGNGTTGLYQRLPYSNTVDLIAGAPAGQKLTVFAKRVVLGGVDIDGKRDFMGVAWSDATIDYKGWDTTQGAGSESLIGSMRRADKIQEFAPLGFDTLTVCNRHSIWTGVQTGDVNEPIFFAPRLEDTGCTHASSVLPTEYGVFFLSDDGVRVFDGQNAYIISDAINSEILPILEADSWHACLDPSRKRYYLCGPANTYVYDILKKRWFKWSGVHRASIFFPMQGSRGPTWDTATGTWDSQTQAWWQLLPTEVQGSMYFIKGSTLGVEDAATFANLDENFNPRWFDRRLVGENQDTLMTSLGARMTYDKEGVIELHVPDKPSGDYEPVREFTMPIVQPGHKTQRAFAPFIHTGRGIGLGVRITSGSPRIRRMSVEYQPTGMPFEITGVLVGGEVGGGGGGGGSGPFISDAILRPRPIFTNGFETPGQRYKFGWVENYPDVHDANVLGEANGLFPGFPCARGQFTWHQTGGRDNGGYLTCATNATTEQQVHGSHQGNYLCYSDPPKHGGGTLSTRSSSAFGAFRFNSAPPYRIHILGLGSQDQGTFGTGTESGVTYFVPNFSVYVNPDMSMGVTTGHPNDIGGLIDHPSTTILPLGEWFGLELAGHNQPNGNNVAGFVMGQLYLIGGPISGVSFLRAIGIPTHSGLLNAFAIGSEVAAASNGFAGVDIDDFTPCSNTGSVKRMVGNIYTGASRVAGAGDETNSIVAFTSVPHPIQDSAHVVVEAGLTVNHGDPARWKNVDGIANVRPFQELLHNALRFDTRTSVDPTPLAADLSYGGFSAGAGTWQEGPFAPPQARYLNVGSPPTFDVAADENAIVRNTFHDEGKDLYTVNIDRTGIALIEGIQPAFRVGARGLVGGVLQHGVSAAYTDLFSAIDDKVALRPTDADHDSNNLSVTWRRHCKFLLKDAHGLWAASTVNALGGAQHVAGVADVAPSTSWNTKLGYDFEPYSFLDSHPVTGVPFAQLQPSVLEAFQVGIQGDFSAYDADVTPLPQDPAHRWIRFDCCEVAFDYVYHKDIPDLLEHNPFPPIACLIIATPLNRTTRQITLTDATDFIDGAFVSIVIAWGDGTTDSVAAGATISHTYAVPGIYTITETATDSNGLVATFTITPVPAYISATASFTAANPAGNQLVFTDASTAHDETISGRLWTFGDGATSTATNPSHTYAAPGTYVVTLTLTTSISPPGSVSFNNSFVVPFPVFAGCNPSTQFMANTAKVQGDNFHGDNPPLPNYANTAAFDTIYGNGGPPAPGRDAYGTSYSLNIPSDGIDHVIDTVSTFNSHSTLLMAFGKPGATQYTGSGWQTVVSDDASPVEGNVTTEGKYWARVRFQADAGVMAGAYLEMIGFVPTSGFYDYFVESGSLWINTPAGVVSLGADSLVLGTAGFIDFLAYYDGVTTAGHVRTVLWIAPACSLSGVSPTDDRTCVSAGTNSFSTANFDGISFFNAGIAPNGSAIKHIRVADWETMPASVAANPFGVAGL